MIRRYTILVYILLSSYSWLAGQSLDDACANSRERYAVTRDPSLPDAVFVWKITSENGNKIKDSVVYDLGDSIDITWGAPDYYTIKAVEISSYFGLTCVGDTSYSYVRVVGSSIDIGEDKTLCKGDSFIFEPNFQLPDLTWNDTLKASQFSGVAEISDTIYVTGKNSIGCITTDTSYLTVNPLPDVNIIMNNETGKDTTMLCGSQQVTLDIGDDPGIIGHIWHYNDQTEITSFIRVIALPPTSVEPFRFYSVTVENEYGCYASDSVMIERCTPPSGNDVPSAITPNGDGTNETWEIPYLEFYPDATVDIYDRWGRIVFHSTKGYSIPWDGKSEGKVLPMDTYFYIITLDKKSKPIIGNVMIIL